MRTLSYPFLFVGVLSSPALAADIPVIEHVGIEDLRLTKQDWSGIKVTALAGGGFLNGKDTTGFKSFSRSGAIGAAVGYDHQVNNLVVGANLEGLATNFQSSRVTSNSTYKSSTNWLGAATVRVGYDAGRFMPYLSAGIGAGNLKSDRLVNGSSVTKTAYGFVAGVGVEAKITEQVFARADYKHYEFGKVKINHTGIAPFSVDGSADIFNLGVGYRF